MGYNPCLAMQSVQKHHIPLERVLSSRSASVHSFPQIIAKVSGSRLTRAEQEDGQVVDLIGLFQREDKVRLVTTS
jgi:hypothetical protein